MQKRKCTHIISSQNGKRAIYVDELNKKEILSYLNRDERHRDKFRFISEIILNNLRSAKHYCKVEINSKCKNVTEMRFFVQQENDRIYCKEFRSANGVYIVVTAVLHEHKTSEELSSKEISLIEKVGSYNYEI